MEKSESGVKQAFELCSGFIPGMVAKAVCELGIPDILAAHDGPLSALQLVELLSPPPTQPLHEAAERLERLLRCLCAYKVFEAHAQPSVGESPKYSLTPVSRFLERDTLREALVFLLSKQALDPWHYLAQSVLDGVPPFTAAHSMDIWALGAKDPAFNDICNAGMCAPSRFVFGAVVELYDGFKKGVQSLVDVGGGTGFGASTVAARYPSIKVINFDSPVVVSTAPAYPGVQHIGGDMFASVPQADIIMMKGVLHDWNDDDCIKILRNCHKALPVHGKLLILDIVLDPPAVKQSPLQAARVSVDMMMFAHTDGGKERTKNEWELLVKAANFSISRIINLSFPPAIIEAIPVIG